MAGLRIFSTTGRCTCGSSGERVRRSKSGETRSWIRYRGSDYESLAPASAGASSISTAARTTRTLCAGRRHLRRFTPSATRIVAGAQLEPALRAAAPLAGSLLEKDMARGARGIRAENSPRRQSTVAANCLVSTSLGTRTASSNPVVSFSPGDASGPGGSGTHPAPHSRTGNSATHSLAFPDAIRARPNKSMKLTGPGTVLRSTVIFCRDAAGCARGSSRL